MNLFPLFLHFETIGSAINVCILILAAYFVQSDSGMDFRVLVRSAIDAVKRLLRGIANGLQR